MKVEREGRKGTGGGEDALWGRLQRKPDEDGGGERQRGCKEIESLKPGRVPQK